MKFLKRALGIVLFLYRLFAVVLYFNQERILFFPEKLSESHQFRDGVEVEVEVEEGVFINCLWLAKEQSKGVIFYLHGNKGNNRRCLRQAHQFNQDEYDIIMPDYRGFGKSDGEMRNEAQVINDVQKVYDYFVEKLSPNKIILIGYSLGSGMASYLAEQNEVDGLFMVAPYTSLTDMKDHRNVPVPDFLMKYELDTHQRIPHIQCPITIFHAPNDDVIPFYCSQKLKDDYPKIEFVKLGNQGHRGAIFSGNLRARVLRYLEGI